MNTISATLAAGGAALVLLTAWTATGQAGRPARLQITDARVMAPTAAQTGAYFTVRNHGDQPDELLDVRTPLSASAMISRHVYRDGAGRMAMQGRLAVPSHTTVRMTPSTVNIMIRPLEPLRAGRSVPFTLVFRHAGEVRVSAVVTPPGGN
ncbi:copper chaperone PCu(A)C [Actinomadura fulvescens]|uniref:Copper chaperone PCu(A)C n=1 Tax=Actinomadura fulvescens TaxID=46160 RepID=A0ABN3QK75_9ACTN